MSGHNTVYFASPSDSSTLMMQSLSLGLSTFINRLNCFLSIFQFPSEKHSPPHSSTHTKSMLVLYCVGSTSIRIPQSTFWLIDTQPEFTRENCTKRAFNKSMLSVLAEIVDDSLKESSESRRYWRNGEVNTFWRGSEEMQDYGGYFRGFLKAIC